MAKLAGSNIILTTNGLKRIDELVITDQIISRDGTIKTIHTLSKSDSQERMYKLCIKYDEIIMPSTGIVKVAGLAWREKHRTISVKTMWDYYRSYELSGKRRHNLYMLLRNTDDMVFDLSSCTGEYYVAGNRFMGRKLPFRAIPRDAGKLFKNHPVLTIERDPDTKKCGFAGYEDIKFENDADRIKYIIKVIQLPDQQRMEFIGGLIDASFSYTRFGDAILTKNHRPPKDMELVKYLKLLFNSIGSKVEQQYYCILVSNRNKKLKFGFKTINHTRAQALADIRRYWYNMVNTMKILDTKNYYYDFMLNDTDEIYLTASFIPVPNI